MTYNGKGEYYGICNELPDFIDNKVFGSMVKDMEKACLSTQIKMYILDGGNMEEKMAKQHIFIMIQG